MSWPRALLPPPHIRKLGRLRAFEILDDEEGPNTGDWTDEAREVMNAAFSAAMRAAHPEIRDGVPDRLAPELLR